MADDKVVVAPDSTGKGIDATTVTTGAGTVERQAVSIGDPSVNNRMAVKAASTAAAAADQAAVVSLSPNSPAASLVNTNAPNYTDGAIKPPSLTVCGAVRMDGSGNEIIHNAATITANGSQIVDGLQYREANLVLNAKNAPTGTSPQLVFIIQDVDPVDNSTTVGQSVSATLTASGLKIITHSSKTGTVLISWTISGASASFTGFNTSLNTKQVAGAQPSSGTKSSVAGAVSSTTLLAANSNRKAAKFYNDSTSYAYLDETGGTASSSSFTIKMAPGSFYELPQPVYTGLITGIWDTATGSMRVTEQV